mmetsp:Transcript_29389/g.101609  ORF Transcript_29389/g.101609 Transcript_29389/m.101609 type:complete len:235 (+) Transcript_29389:897-1601(+)
MSDERRVTRSDGVCDRRRKSRVRIRRHHNSPAPPQHGVDRVVDGRAAVVGRRRRGARAAAAARQTRLELLQRVVVPRARRDGRVRRGGHAPRARKVARREARAVAGTQDNIYKKRRPQRPDAAGDVAARRAREHEHELRQQGGLRLDEVDEGFDGRPRAPRRRRHGPAGAEGALERRGDFLRPRGEQRFRRLCEAARDHRAYLGRHRARQLAPEDGARQCIDGVDDCARESAAP